MCAGQERTSDVSNRTASLSFRTLTGLFLWEEENDDDSVFFDIVLSNCGVFLTILLSETKKSILRVRTQSTLRQPPAMHRNPPLGKSTRGVLYH